MARIAVEYPLTDVKQELRELGYEAEMLEEKTDSPEYDCVVVRAMDDLVDIHMNVPIIEARGRSVSDIAEEVKVRLQRTGEMRDPESESEGMSGKPLMSGMAVGAVVGVTAGILLAPKSGKELRQNVNEKATQTKEQTTNLATKVREQSSVAKENVAKIRNRAKTNARNELTGIPEGVQERPIPVKQ
ncbi:YkuS family protein [Bacillus piscicola]|uniref:YkuS family protein n=1 Tax=Bacillus piscicola TaxID=1632684 RepID=UPI001F09659C|nr:YkuS family protein [Bacillus piscicola]